MQPDSPSRSLPGLSLVAPAYDEEANLVPLYERVAEAMGTGAAAGLEWELVLVDDGSRDGTRDVIRELARRDERVRGVLLARNCGQTAALAAGLRATRAPLVATLDADMQNDPIDLPALLAALGENDAVVGYRAVRNDTWVRRMSSRIANGFRNWATHDQVRDTGCGLKLFRRDAVLAIPLFEGMHRFFPTLLRMHGFTVIEHAVSHHPRVRGKSKYGIHNRLWKSLRDLVAVRWMRSRAIVLPGIETTDLREVELAPARSATSPDRSPAAESGAARAETRP